VLSRAKKKLQNGKTRSQTPKPDTSQK
jgi:hypothetical protein